VAHKSHSGGKFADPHDSCHEYINIFLLQAVDCRIAFCRMWHIIHIAANFRVDDFTIHKAAQVQTAPPSNPNNTRWQGRRSLRPDFCASLLALEHISCDRHCGKRARRSLGSSGGHRGRRCRQIVSSTAGTLQQHFDRNELGQAAGVVPGRGGDGTVPLESSSWRWVMRTTMRNHKRQAVATRNCTAYTREGSV